MFRAKLVGHLVQDEAGGASRREAGIEQTRALFLGAGTNELPRAAVAAALAEREPDIVIDGSSTSLMASTFSSRVLHTVIGGMLFGLIVVKGSVAGLL